jgi:hypothetical protein
VSEQGAEDHCDQHLHVKVAEKFHAVGLTGRRAGQNGGRKAAGARRHFGTGVGHGPAILARTCGAERGSTGQIRCQWMERGLQREFP